MKASLTRCAIAVTLLGTIGTAFAAASASGQLGVTQTQRTPAGPVGGQLEATQTRRAPVMVTGGVTICPAPYTKSAAGMDVSKGESQCIKTEANCGNPGFVSQSNAQTGQLTCLPSSHLAQHGASVPLGPTGWSGGRVGDSHVYVYNSNPQPVVNCPKSTPDWKSGSSYFKESWNRMGCRANPFIHWEGRPPIALPPSPGG
jgi:hypothetical protein